MSKPEMISLNDALTVMFNSRSIDTFKVASKWRNQNFKIRYGFINDPNYIFSVSEKGRALYHGDLKRGFIYHKNMHGIEQCLENVLVNYQKVSRLRFHKISEKINLQKRIFKVADIRFCLADVPAWGCEGNTFLPKGHFQGVSGYSTLTAINMYTPAHYVNNAWTFKISSGGVIFNTLSHETGHAIGLGHTAYQSHRKIQQHHYDTIKHSVMSYNSQQGFPFNFNETDFPTTLQINDVAALQILYGKNDITNAGHTIYRMNKADLKKQQSLWDPSGQDTFDFSKAESGIFDMRPGESSYFGSFKRSTKIKKTFSLCYRTHIENAIGARNQNVFFTNSLNNKIDAEGGNNWFFVSDRQIQTRLYPAFNKDNTLTISAKRQIFARQYYRKTLRANHQKYIGWGHDVYQCKGGFSRIFINAIMPDQMSFKRSQKNLIVEYKSRKGRLLSSLTIKGYNPNRCVIFIGYRNNSAARKILKEHRKLYNNFKKTASDSKYKRTALYMPNCVKEIQAEYANKVTLITQKKHDVPKYLPLVVR